MVALFLGSKSTQAQVNYQPWSFSQTLSSAQSSGKYILVTFEASWCQPCQWMKKHVYRSSHISNKINAEFAAIKSDMTYANEWSERYQVDALPYALIIDSNGNKVADLKGTATLNEFSSFLDCKCQVKAPPAAIPIYASMVNNETSAADRYWTVQIGKYVGPHYANRLKDKAAKAFDDVHILYEKDRYGRDIYRVFVGLFIDEFTAKYTLGILQDQGYKGFTKYL